jgi:hypothetical protein
MIHSSAVVKRRQRWRNDRYLLAHSVEEPGGAPILPEISRFPVGRVKDEVQMSHFATSARTAMLAAGAALLIGLGAATPARALDDGDQNIFETVKGLLGAGIGFGLGGGNERPRIDYRERAPLVLPPPGAALPPPAPAVAERNPAWPRDYDQERMRRNQSQATVLRNDNNFGAMTAQELRTVGRLRQNEPRNPAAESCRDGDFGELCNPTAFWRVMKTTSSAPDTTRDLVAGQEPPRSRLTDPPKGFRTATRNQRYTFEIKEEASLNDPRAQLREEQRRARQVD